MIKRILSAVLTLSMVAVTACAGSGGELPNETELETEKTAIAEITTTVSTTAENVEITETAEVTKSQRDEFLDAMGYIENSFTPTFHRQSNSKQ